MIYNQVDFISLFIYELYIFNFSLHKVNKIYN